jgi:KaiC/GvpD/RAD55 family RecA-like ATPase
MSSPLESHRHCVKFYENDASLFSTVGEFLCQGLIDGHPAIVIATPEHLRGITESLANHLIDIGKAARTGRLVVLDAEETLKSFMVGDMPDADAFAREVGDVVANSVTASGGRAVVRAYGEMVDILWRDGRHDAAIRLEMLWNRLAAKHQFSLLCAYAMGSFYKETDLLERVCAEHTHVLPPFDVPDGTTVH